MLHPLMPTALENVERAGDVALHVGMRCLDRIAHARLSPKMHHTLEFFLCEAARHTCGVRAIKLNEAKARLLLKQSEACLLQGDVVVVIEIVEANDLVAALEQTPRRMKTDEARGSGDQDLHRRPSTSAAGNTLLIS